MKIHNKISLLYVFLFFGILPACYTVVQETSPSTTKSSISGAMDAISEAVKDTKQSPFCASEKVVRNVEVSEEGIKFINADNTERYFAYTRITGPRIYQGNISGLYCVDMGHPCNNINFGNLQSAKKFADALFYLKNNSGNIEQGIKNERQQEREDCLRLVRQTSVEPILAGTTVSDLGLPCAGVDQVSLEAILNDKLIDWKSKEFPEYLRRSNPTQLRELVVRLEKGILRLDLKAKEFKDVSDAEARKVKLPGKEPAAKGAPEELSRAHVLDQRKTILMVLLGAVKTVAAQRASSGI
ncbi:MAG: hypothetical protein M1438_12855 [Deltaproteobacteria bacterium]|nr:hypothetical protein [Deltaproteobacteria bacterium]